MRISYIQTAFSPQTELLEPAAGPYDLPITIQTLLHLVFPAFRVLLLVPLFFALVLPRVVYTPLDADDDDVSPNASSFLLPAGNAPPSTGLSAVPGLSAEATKYGTFRSAHPAIPPSGATTRAHTPVPSTRRDKVRIIRTYLVRT